MQEMLRQRGEHAAAADDAEAQTAKGISTLKGQLARLSTRLDLANSSHDAKLAAVQISMDATTLQSAAALAAHVDALRTELERSAAAALEGTAAAEMKARAAEASAAQAAAEVAGLKEGLQLGARAEPLATAKELKHLKESLAAEIKVGSSTKLYSHILSSAT